MAQRKDEAPRQHPDMKGGYMPAPAAIKSEIYEELLRTQARQARELKSAQFQHQRITSPEFGVKVTTTERAIRRNPWMASDEEMGYVAKPGE